jgi:DNA-binding HxlR family transcriptional regulator
LNNMKKIIKATRHSGSECSQYVLPIRDCLDIISGKWKLPILGALTHGKKRFKEMEREIPKITPRMLSKELRELEMNQLVSRKVYDTKPVTVEYELSPYGRSLDKVLDAMKEWGQQHRKRIIGK